MIHEGVVPGGRGYNQVVQGTAGEEYCSKAFQPPQCMRLSLIATFTCMSVFTAKSPQLELSLSNDYLRFHHVLSSLDRRCPIRCQMLLQVADLATGAYNSVARLCSGITTLLLMENVSEFSLVERHKKSLD